MVYQNNPYLGYTTTPPLMIQPQPQLYPMLNEYQQSTTPALPQPKVPDPTNIVWVQGEAGAMAHHLDPGQMMALFDSERDYLYLAAQTSENIPVRIKKYQLVEVPLDSEKSTEVIMPDIDLSDYVGREEFDRKLKELGYVTREEFEQAINDLRSINGSRKERR